MQAVKSDTPHTARQQTREASLGPSTRLPTSCASPVHLCYAQHLIEMMMRHQQRLKDIADGKREVPKGRQLYNGMNTSQHTTHPTQHTCVRPHSGVFTVSRCVFPL